jgi:glycosyltransferase involved in cell wall biosynthesis
VGYPSVSVVVPALNEERNIPHVFDRIPEDIHQVVLVDGCSVDETVAVARRLRPDVSVVSQTRRVRETLWPAASRRRPVT